MTWMRDNLGAILNHLVEGQFGVYLLCLVAAGSTRPRNLSDGNDTGPSNNISPSSPNRFKSGWVGGFAATFQLRGAHPSVNEFNGLLVSLCPPPTASRKSKFQDPPPSLVIFAFGQHSNEALQNLIWRFHCSTPEKKTVVSSWTVPTPPPPADDGRCDE